jgi:hypothetical protein
MTSRRSFLVALVMSLVLHLGVLSAPSWRFSLFDTTGDREETRTITARLSAPPRPNAPVPAKPRPAKKIRQPAPAVPNVLREAPVAPPEVVEEQVQEPPRDESTAQVEEALPELLAPRISLPRYARIRFRVTMGEGGFVIGQAIQELRHDNSTYEMRSTAATTGLAGFLKPVQVVNISQGDVIGGSLRPRRFRIERDKGNSDWADLDWQSGNVVLSNGRNFPLEAGAQDMLSMFGQLALKLDGMTVLSLPVVTGKKVERYDFSVLGEEVLATPLGEQRATVHLRGGQANSKESTDVWLGREDALLPVKIRFVDRRGDVYEQIAESIEFDMEAEGTH